MSSLLSLYAAKGLKVWLPECRACAYSLQAAIVEEVIRLGQDYLYTDGDEQTVLEYVLSVRWRASTSSSRRALVCSRPGG
jgi:hypothetical protein